MTNEELVLAYQLGQDKALELLIEKNNGLIWKLVKNFYVSRINCMDDDDLYQTAVLGFIVAVKKFNTFHGAKFTTFVVHYIRGYLYRAISKSNTTKESSLNIELTNANDSSTTVEDTLIDPAAEEYIEEILVDYDNRLLNKELIQAMQDNLTLHQQEVIELKYGFKNFKEMSHKSIAEILNSEESIIRSTERKSIRILRTSNWGRARIQNYNIQKVEEAKLIKYKNINTFHIYENLKKKIDKMG